jgi:P pilus assembly chaperone PapD
VLVCSALAATDVMAATALSATRMVLREAEGSSSINVRNDDDAPTLIQAWIDDGRTQVSPELIDTPFQVVPPLLRVEAGASRLLRVQRVRPDALPGDRESLFWLNLMEIPRNLADGRIGESSLQLGNGVVLPMSSREFLLSAPPTQARVDFQWVDDHGALHPAHALLDSPSPDTGAAQVGTAPSDGGRGSMTLGALPGTNTPSRT